MTQVGNLWDQFESGGPKKKEYAAHCYESHPVIELGNGGKLYGGNCQFPAIKTANVYVALQYGGQSGLVPDPWEEPNGIVEITYEIHDMDAPRNVPRFKKLVDYLCNQLQLGRTVHVGCIGGHGRTGIVLAAVVQQMTGNADAISWVRAHYCKKAVESYTQVEFLNKYYGITKVGGSKSSVTPVFKGKNNKIIEGLPLLGKKSGGQVVTRTVRPAPSNRSIWRKDKLVVVKTV